MTKKIEECFLELVTFEWILKNGLVFEMVGLEKNVPLNGYNNNISRLVGYKDIL